ncbi:hypothetical protein EVJ58_g5096, partial [Rhodofomes roseus]
AKDTHSWSDPLDKYDFEDKLSPDVIIYPSHADARRAYTLKDLTSLSEEERKRHENKARTSWLWATLYIEAKADAEYSPFVIPDSMREAEAQKEEEMQAAATQTSTKATPQKKKKPSQKTRKAAQKRAQKQKSADSAGALSSTTDSLIRDTQASATTSQASFAAPSLSASMAAGPSTAATPLAPPIAHVPAADTSTPSRDELPPFLLLQSKERSKTMGQMSHYVSKIMRRQFLLHFFTIFTCCDVAWLLRWDRAGLIVSEPFNLVNNPRPLHTFLYRFARMSDTDRGHDPSVVPATEAEAQLLRSFNKFPPPEDWCRELFASTLVDGWPISKILVPEDDMISEAELRSGKKEERGASEASGRRMREFLVGKPTFMNTSVYGRATRCHIAYDVAEDRLVFCKECWRMDTPTSHPEGEVYLRLHSQNVNYIATPVAAGDVCDEYGNVHCTRSQEFIEGSDPMLIHYRLILEEIAQPLKEYESSYQLVVVMYCCLQGEHSIVIGSVSAMPLTPALLAHEQAWSRGKTIHRDISADNLMLYWYYEDGELVWKGVLVDWGLCKYADEINQPSVRRNRSGTWQFISAVLLRWPGKFVHQIWNDLESFIHVLHWMCLRFQITNKSSDRIDLISHVARLYDYANKDDEGDSVGGHTKLQHLQDGTVPFHLIGGSAATEAQLSHGLHSLLRELAKLSKQHYKWLDPQLPESAQANSRKAESQKVVASKGKQARGIRAAQKSEPFVLQNSVAAPSPPEPPLSTHRVIMGLFDVMVESEDTWVVDDKVADQFACDNNFLEQQQRQSREASRRSSEMESLAEEKPHKRVRTSTNAAITSGTSGSQLNSISEHV